MRSVTCLLLLVLAGAVTAGEPEGDDFYQEQVLPTALNIYNEGRGESELGQKMIAWVTLKRAEEDRREWGGKTIHGVVYKGCQFSWTCDAKIKAKKPSGPAWDKAVAVATVVAVGLFEPPAQAEGIAFARYYMNPDESSPKNRCWMATTFKQVAVVGNHYFYRELKPGEKVTYVPPRFGCTKA